MQKINRKAELDIRENGGNKEKVTANERRNHARNTDMHLRVYL